MASFINHSRKWLRTCVHVNCVIHSDRPIKQENWTLASVIGGGSVILCLTLNKSEFPIYSQISKCRITQLIKTVYVYIFKISSTWKRWYQTERVQRMVNWKLTKWTNLCVLFCCFEWFTGVVKAVLHTQQLQLKMHYLSQVYKKHLAF